MYSYLALVLLQRVFDQPVVGLVALAIIVVTRSGRRADHALTNSAVPRGMDGPAGRGPGHRLCASGLAGDVLCAALSVNRPTPLRGDASGIALSVGDRAHGDLSGAAGHRVGRGRSRRGRRLRRRAACWPGTASGTLVCGLAGSVVSPVVYAMHPPYKAMGARIGFAFWTPVLFLLVVMSGLTMFVSQLIPVVDSGGDDRLRFDRSGDGDTAPRGPEIFERRAARICASGGSRSFRGDELRAAGAAASAANPGRAGGVESIHLLVVDARARATDFCFWCW